MSAIEVLQALAKLDVTRDLEGDKVRSRDLRNAQSKTYGHYEFSRCGQDTEERLSKIQCLTLAYRLEIILTKSEGATSICSI